MRNTAIFPRQTDFGRFQTSISAFCVKICCPVCYEVWGCGADVRDLQDSQSWVVTLTILGRHIDNIACRNRVSWGAEWCVLYEKSVFQVVRDVLFWRFGKRKPMKTRCFFVSRKVLSDVIRTACAAIVGSPSWRCPAPHADAMHREAERRKVRPRREPLRFAPYSDITKNLRFVIFVVTKVRQYH